MLRLGAPMSSAKKEYRPFFSWRQAMMQSDLPGTTKLVAHTLAAHMNAAGEACYPSIKTIMAEASLSNRAVCTHLERLAADGWIVIEQHGFKGQRWRRNSYRLAWPASIFGGDKRGERGSPRFDEGGEPNHTKVVNEVHTNSPRNSPLPPSLEDADAPSREAPPLPLVDDPPVPTKRGTRLNVDSLPPSWRAFCEAERPDLDPERVFAQFTDHWRAAPGQKGLKRDWSATWRNWIRRQGQYDGFTTGKTKPDSATDTKRRRAGLAAAAAEQMAAGISSAGERRDVGSGPGRSGFRLGADRR